MAWLGGGILVCSIFVLPLAQLGSTLPESAVWGVLGLAVAVTGFIVIGILPWVAAAPRRRIRRQLLRARPGLFATIVDVISEERASGSGVIVADKDGVSLVGFEFDDLVILWTDVESIELARFEVLETIEMSTLSRKDSIHLLLMKSNGIQQLPTWELSECLATLQRMHRTATSVA